MHGYVNTSSQGVQHVSSVVINSRAALVQAVFSQRKDKEVEHVLATNSVVAWATSCWKKNQEVMEREWNHTLMSKVSWKQCTGSASSVRLQLGDSGTTWPRYDVIVSPNSRNTNLKETCF